MGTWNATIFGNDASCDTKDEFFMRYNRGEEPRDIKDDLLSEIDGDDRFNVMFSLAYCMWEVGMLDDDFLSEVEATIQSEKDLALAENLGADEKFLRQRRAHLAKFLDKISVKRAKPKKRVAPPVPVESKYMNGAVMAFQYDDGTWGALIAVDSQFFDKETYYAYLQTTVKTVNKPTVDDVRKSHIIDASFHNREYNSLPLRSPQLYYSFVNCICGYLNKTETKRFESYNDDFFEIIGYLSDWGRCSSGTADVFEYCKKTADEFADIAREILTTRLHENPDAHTEMTVEEIDKEFIDRQNSYA